MPELIDTLYPRRCPSTGQTCLLCPEPVRLIVCLPAQVAYERHRLAAGLITALTPHVAVPTGLLDGGHFLLWHQPADTETPLLLGPTADPRHPEPDLVCRRPGRAAGPSGHRRAPAPGGG